MTKYMCVYLQFTYAYALRKWTGATCNSPTRPELLGSSPHIRQTLANSALQHSGTSPLAGTGTSFHITFRYGPCARLGARGERPVHRQARRDDRVVRSPKR